MGRIYTFLFTGDSVKVFTTKCVMQGLPSLSNLGYRRRVGIFELMRMSDSIHGLVIKSASAPDIREVAFKRA